MRSRYAAFKLSLAKYIIKTTHKENPDYSTDIIKWEKDILDFSNNFTFVKLNILEFIDGEEIANVTFHVNILLKENDASFTEKSTFQKHNNQWLYHSGIQL